MPRPCKSDTMADLIDYPFPDYVLEAYMKIQFEERKDIAAYCTHYESCKKLKYWMPMPCPNRTLQFRKAINSHPQSGKEICVGCMYDAIAKLCNFKPSKAEEEKIAQKSRELVAQLVAEINSGGGSNYEAQTLQLVD